MPVRTTLRKGEGGDFLDGDVGEGKCLVRKLRILGQMPCEAARLGDGVLILKVKRQRLAHVLERFIHRFSSGDTSGHVRAIRGEIVFSGFDDDEI